MRDFTVEEFEHILEVEGIKRMDDRDLYEVAPGCVYWVKEYGKMRREVLSRLMRESAAMRAGQRFCGYVKDLEK